MKQARSKSATISRSPRGRARVRKNIWPFSSAATSPRNTTPATGGIAARAGKKGSRAKGQQYKGYSITLTADGFKAMDSEFDTLRDAKRFIDAWTKRNPSKRRNPAEASDEAYKDFHGKQSTETLSVTRRVHFHKHLAAAGSLRRLLVETVGGTRKVSIRFAKGTILAFNEDRNQLFIEGGDQSVNLKDFGITRPHEVETLGKVIEIDYFTTKDHLGAEGGAAIYRHKFRTTNEGGKHVTLRVARCPDLIYRVRDKQMEFSGGSYEIIPEGIDR